MRDEAFKLSFLEIVHETKAHMTTGTPMKRKWQAVRLRLQAAFPGRRIATAKSLDRKYSQLIKSIPASAEQQQLVRRSQELVVQLAQEDTSQRSSSRRKRSMDEDCWFLEPTECCWQPVPAPAQLLSWPLSSSSSLQSIEEEDLFNDHSFCWRIER